VAYSPWSNETVEVVCREVLRALRALVSELQLGFKHWPSVVPMLPSTLNNQPSNRLDGTAPITAMTSLPVSTPILSVLSPVNEVGIVSLEHIVAERAANLALLRDALDSIHRALAKSVAANRDRRHANKNAATAATLPNFILGDYLSLC
jgi:hypothetical protein